MPYTDSHAVWMALPGPSMWKIQGTEKETSNSRGERLPPDPATLSCSSSDSRSMCAVDKVSTVTSGADSHGELTDTYRLCTAQGDGFCSPHSCFTNGDIKVWRD